MKFSLALIDDEKTIREGISFALESEFDIQTFENAEDGLAAIAAQPPDLVLLDVGLPGMNGIEALSKIREMYPEMLVIMITAFEDTETVVSAMKLGAYDYVVKPIIMGGLAITIRNALESIRLRKEVKLLQENYLKDQMPFFIAKSDRIQEIMDFIAKAAGSPDTPVLILGETGTGKELVARAVHSRSERRAKPFVTINCAAVPENLLESEFFGHEKGAFSGAVSQRIGKFEKAHTGTLFLDEIGDIPLELQAKILRVIEDGKITRLGSNREIDCDFRVICATNRPIQDMIRKELFREDLFYRISVFPIIIPPLRERKDDISLLVDHFIKKYSAKFGSQVTGISREAMNQLLGYSWPGNVREMENAIQRAIVSCRSDRIEHLPDLGKNLHEAVSTPVEDAADAPTIWVDAGGGAGYHDIKHALIEQFERKYFEHLMKKHGGVIAEAARESGLNYKTFYLKAEKLGLTKKRLRMDGSES